MKITAVKQVCHPNYTTAEGLEALPRLDLSRSKVKYFGGQEILDPANYLTGAEAEIAHNQLTYAAHSRLNHSRYDDWLIIDGVRDKKRFHRGKIDAEGNWRGYRLKKKNGRYVESGAELTGDDIRAIAKEHGNGVWHLPQTPFLHPLADDCHPTNVLKGEWDTTDTDPKNWLWVQVLKSFKAKEFAPNAITSSAGKCDGLSPHAEWHFATTLDPAAHAYLRYILMGLGADPGALNKRMSQFRKPGFYRHSRGREQGLFKEFHDKAYDVQEWVNCAIAVGKELGIEILTPQEWHQAEAEKAEKNAQATPIDLGQFEGGDIEKLLVEVDQQCPSYSPGGGTYPYRFKLWGAAHALVGDNARDLCPNIFDGGNFGTLKRTNVNPIGTIVNQFRLLLGNPKWRLPGWWTEKYPYDPQRDQWLKHNQLTRIGNDFSAPNMEGVELFKPGYGNHFKAGMGVGKTHELIKQSQGKKIVQIGYRVNLNAQTVGKINKEAGKIVMKTMDDLTIQDIIEGVNVSVNIDSLPKLQRMIANAGLTLEHFFADRYVVLDEVTSVINYKLFSKTLGGKQFDCVTLTGKILRNCLGFVTLDANLADWAVDYLGKISGKPQWVNCNRHNNIKAKMTFLDGAMDIDDEKIRKHDHFGSLLEMREYADNGKAFAVCSDSQLFLESIEHYLKTWTNTTKIFRWDGTTSSTKEAKLFRQDPDQWLTNHPQTILLYNTAAESGIDISIKGYFAHHYGFAFGIITANPFAQLMGRIRDQNVERSVWARTFSIATNDDSISLMAEALAYYERQALMLEANLLFDEVEVVSRVQEISLNSLQDETALAFKLKAIANYEKANLRQCIFDVLTAAGYQIETKTIVRTDEIKAAKTSFKESKEITKDKHVNDVATASDEFIGQPTARLSMDANYADQCALEKAYWCDRLPGLFDPGDMNRELLRLIKYDAPRLVNGLEKLTLMENPDLARTIGKHRLNRILESQTAVPWMNRSNYLECRFLASIGAERLIGPLLATYETNQKLTADDPLLIEIHAKAKGTVTIDGQKGRGKVWLKRSIPQCPAKFASLLLSKLGMPHYCRGGKISINRKAWDVIDPYYQALKDSVKARLETITNRISSQPVPEKPVSDISATSKTPQSHTGQDFNLFKNRGYFYNNDSTIFHPNVLSIKEDQSMPIKQPIDWEDLKAGIKAEMTRLGWGKERARLQAATWLGLPKPPENLQTLTDDQIITVWQRMKATAQ